MCFSHDPTRQLAQKVLAPHAPPSNCLQRSARAYLRGDLPPGWPQPHLPLGGNFPRHASVQGQKFRLICGTVQLNGSIGEKCEKELSRPAPLYSNQSNSARENKSLIALVLHTNRYKNETIVAAIALFCLIPSKSGQKHPGYGKSSSSSMTRNISLFRTGYRASSSSHCRFGKIKKSCVSERYEASNSRISYLSRIRS